MKFVISHSLPVSKTFYAIFSISAFRYQCKVYGRHLVEHDVARVQSGLPDQEVCDHSMRCWLQKHVTCAFFIQGKRLKAISLL